MTIEAVSRKAGPFAGNGVTTAFPFEFQVTSASYLRVTKTDSTGLDAVLVQDTHYSVALNSDQIANPGGTVTYPLSGSPLAVGNSLTIEGSLQPSSQETRLANGGGFFPETIEQRLDYITTLLQQHDALLARAVKGPPTDAAALADLPTKVLRAGKYSAFDSNGDPVASAGSGTDTALRTDLANGAAGPGSDLVAIKRSNAEILAFIIPSDYTKLYGDVQRYGWSASNTGAQNATALAAAALVWASGGPHIHIPAGTFNLTQFVIPAGRGLIIEGEGQTPTKLVHSTGGSMIVLGADDIQSFQLRNIKLEPSATTTRLIDISGDYQASHFEWHDVELHQGTSGNTTCIGLYIAGGTTGSHQKHYNKWYGGKIFGLGTGFSLYNGGAAAAANDLTAVGFQMQGCAADGILVNDSAGNRFVGSVENCGDGATTYNYRIEGSISSENIYEGRLENNGAKAAFVPYKISATAGPSNRVYATMTATPANYNDAFAPPGCLLFDNGIELSNVQERAKGLRRVLGAATTDYLLRYMLSTDTMGSFGRHGVRIDGRQSWATGTNPAGWDTHLERVAVGGLQVQGGVANRLSNSGNVTGAITPDLSSGWNRRLVLTGNVTINAPTNPPAGGGIVTFLLVQDATGGRTVTFDAVFKLAGGAYTMTATANKRDVISFMYSDTDATYQEMSRSQNQN